jgi:UDP-N-acetylmuramoyl-tripeptide--D-alanyl-D-alanine ligase
MGSEAAIAVEKAAIFSGLSPKGTAVLPGDSKFLALLRSKIPEGARQIVFGLEAGDARLLKVKAGAQASDIAASICGSTVKFHLGAPGVHMAGNALAVLAAAAALGLELDEAALALEGFSPFTGRGARRKITVTGGEALLLDESYNASAASMRAALAVLELQPGRHVAVLGDMLELGEHAASEHFSLLPAVLAAADAVFACGAETKILFDSLPASMQGAYASDAAELAPLLRAALGAGDTVLVKGSYGSRMRDVISLLEGPA